MKKTVRCLYVKPFANNDETAPLELQGALCRSFADKQGWTICNESKASLFFDDEITPNIFKQLIDICCTAPVSKFDVLLIESRSCLDIPEEYVEQVMNWLHQNNVETWSVKEGKLA
ncbi:MAG: hypothetical protein ACI3W5_16510 [Faecousia sp.]